MQRETPLIRREPEKRKKTKNMKKRVEIVQYNVWHIIVFMIYESCSFKRPLRQSQAEYKSNKQFSKDSGLESRRIN